MKQVTPTPEQWDTFLFVFREAVLKYKELKDQATAQVSDDSTNYGLQAAATAFMYVSVGAYHAAGAPEEAIRQIFDDALSEAHKFLDDPEGAVGRKVH